MSRATADSFPVDSFREAAAHLRRPFTPAAVKFKPQSVTRTGKTLCVAYIDARLVIERLNLICPHLWHDAYEPTSAGMMWCHLTVDGITRSDVGEGKGKALVSDALKRAAVHFGIGVPLYAVPQSFLDGEIKFLSDQHQRQLRQGYERWLKQHGVQAFGDPLDHGDAEDSQGDAEAPASVPEGAVSSPAATHSSRAQGVAPALSSSRPARHPSDVTPDPDDVWVEGIVTALQQAGIWDDRELLLDGLKQVGVVPAPGAQRKSVLKRLEPAARLKFRAWLDGAAEQMLVDEAAKSLAATEVKAA